MKVKVTVTKDAAESSIINENASLQQFYSLTNELSKNRHVRFTGKTDEADNIVWSFRYRGRNLNLQYSIYNGLSLEPEDVKDARTAYELVDKIKSKSAV
jgi:hypothetical protein